MKNKNRTNSIKLTNRHNPEKFKESLFKNLKNSFMKKSLLIVLSVILVSTNITFSQSTIPDPDFWLSDGPSDVDAIAVDGGYTYIGGGFSYVGPRTGYGIKTTTTDSDIDFTFPEINGHITKVVSDEAGGWFIGGGFTKVGGYSRNNLVRLNSDGTVHAWNPNANGIVEALYFDGSDVYVCGQFTSVGGQPRTRIAKLDDVVGVADPFWSANASNVVYSIFVDNSNVFVGGTFNSIKSVTRNKIAKLSKTNGDVDLTWDANANNTVESISASLDMSGDATEIYAGGSFTTIGGVSRSRIAKLNNSDGIAYSWNPSANHTVYVVKVDGSNIFAGGRFTTIGGASRNYIAKLQSDGTAHPNFYPSADERVRDIAIDADNIYIAGYFLNVEDDVLNYNRNRIAKIDKTNGAVDASWDPGAGHDALCIALSGNNVYTGGIFITGGGKTRNGLARINNSDGTLDLNWDPNPDGSIYCVEFNGDYLYAGGYFDSISSSPLKNLARLNKSDGSADVTWTPDPNNPVYDIIFPGDDIIVAGAFTNIGGQSRSRIAKINNTNGDAYAGWNASPNQDVNCIAYDYNGTDYDIYAGGVFTSIGEQSRNKIAKLKFSDGTADVTWNANANNTVNTIAIFDHEIYAGGDFTSIGSLTRNRIAKLNNSDGEADAGWNPNASWSVRCIRPHGSKLYVGGLFTSINSIPHYGIARLDLDSGIPDGWDPYLNGGVIDIAFSKRGNVYICGGFSIIGGKYLYDESAVFKRLERVIIGSSKREAHSKHSSETVEVRNSSSPYNIISTTTSIGGEGLEIPTYLPNLFDNTLYYIVIKNMNSIETWSNPVSFTDGILEYDFTSSISQAYGNNMTLVNGKWSFYSGDSNQDGTIDVSDGGDIDNDGFNFVTGVVPTDINGDEIVDLADGVFADNNAFNFVSVIRP